MDLLDSLRQRWEGHDHPFLAGDGGSLTIDDVLSHPTPSLSRVRPGDVVALIGDFNAASISALLQLVSLGAITVPLTVQTRHDHDYFLDASLADHVLEDGVLTSRDHGRRHELIDVLRARGNPGLVLFSTGTTGRPKAILHDMSFFLRRFETPRPTLRSLGFLLFDHIGGLNTLFHTIFNRGTVISVADRSVEGVLDACDRYQVEALPTTPTFLRMMLLSGLVPDKVPPSLQIISYGTERMDQPTLDQLCDLLPDIDFRQTFGMSELGIVRVKSEARNSLFMRIGGEGVTTRVTDGILEILSPSRMLGYLNAPSPFDEEGWYRTGDAVEERDGFIKVIGRTTDFINVGGLKFVASEVERVALAIEGVKFAVATARDNPITGQHVEMLVELQPGSTLSTNEIIASLRGTLPAHMVPRRVRLGEVGIGHRFKKS